MPRGEPKEGAIARGAGIGATMRGVCAWCGKELRAGQGAEALETTHGICEECYLDLRVKETLRRLWEGTGPFTLFVPPNRVDVVMRLWRELGLTVIFVTHDTDEAVYLSSRVIALSKPPAVVRVDLAIELPHPRDQITTRELPLYLNYRHQLLAQLFADEGLRSVAAAH